MDVGKHFGGEPRFARATTRRVPRSRTSAERTRNLLRAVLSEPRLCPPTRPSAFADVTRDDVDTHRTEEALRESLGRREPEHVDRATTMYVLASVRGTQGKNEDSVELFEDALLILQASYTDSNESNASGLRLATGLNNYGYWLKMNGDYHDAVIRYQESYALREKHAGKNHTVTIISLQNIAELLSSQGEEEKWLVK